MTLVLRNARVIDGTAAPPRDGCTIVVEDIAVLQHRSRLSVMKGGRWFTRRIQ
jgi:hypothetical protein